MPNAEERFRSKVQRRGGHEIWTGARNQRGVGLVRIDGKLRTAQRAAWEFAYGPIPAGVRVNGCARERACVRVDHLSLSPGGGPARAPSGQARRPRGRGSLRQLPSGAWQISAPAGSTPAGRPTRRFATVHGSRDDAERALDELVAAMARTDLGDLRVRELVDRHLTGSTNGKPSAGVARDRATFARILEPSVGAKLAAFLEPLDIETALRDAHRGGAPTSDLSAALGVLRTAYRWARQRGWSQENPAADLTLRDVISRYAHHQARASHRVLPAGE